MSRFGEPASGIDALRVLTRWYSCAGVVGTAVRLEQPAMAPMVVLTMVLNIAAQVGDLVESLIKRGAGVKDSGAILPGHGGMLDRIDALLFAAPVLWYYAAWSVLQ